MASPLAPSALAAPSAGGAQREPFTFAPTRALLVLIAGPDATGALADHRLPNIDPTSAAEAAVLRECAAGESQRTQAGKGFLWSVVTQAWRVILHPLAVSVHDELLKYSRVSEATASGDYYRADEPAAGGGGAPHALTSRISCLRFTRFTTGEPNGEEVALDFIASVGLDPAGDAIRLRPLRLYIGKADARSADGHYSVAIAVRAHAVWRDEFVGHSDKVFAQTVATESLDLKAGSFLKYYPLEAGSGMRVPIVPVSFGVNRSHDFGRAEFAVSVAELGTPSQTLTMLADILPDPNEPMEKLLVAAALARIGLQ
ncbi:MAG: hypothetical protein JOZ89_04295 [Gammaproteobacteria bacterium]|nr:hypothetical protein [Gammaproteobacteria bacterium]